MFVCLVFQLAKVSLQNYQIQGMKFICFRTIQNASVMELAINKHLSGVVASLCKHRAHVNDVTSKGDPLIWHALETEDFNICDILVGTSIFFSF